jgi:hypothetical protein
MDCQVSAQAFEQVYRFWAASWAGCKRAGRSSHPAQLYSRSTTLESLLSVALSFIERLDCIIQFHFEKVGSLSILKWAHFQN